MEDQGTNRESGGMKTPLAALLVLATAVCHVVIGVLFYRYVWGPDLVVFFLPTLTAIGVNTLIIGAAMPATWKAVAKYAAACGRAVVAGVIAEIVCLTIAFNMYGT
jgi:hypothetical protein